MIPNMMQLIVWSFSQAFWANEHIYLVLKPAICMERTFGWVDSVENPCSSSECKWQWYVDPETKIIVKSFQDIGFLVTSERTGTLSRFFGLVIKWQTPLCCNWVNRILGEVGGLAGGESKNTADEAREVDTRWDSVLCRLSANCLRSLYNLAGNTRSYQCEVINKHGSWVKVFPPF